MSGGIFAEGEAPDEQSEEAGDIDGVDGEELGVGEEGFPAGDVQEVRRAGHGGPGTEDGHEAGPSGGEPAHLFVPGDAVAEDEEHLGGENEHPRGEDEGVDEEDLGRGRLLGEEAGDVEAEAGDHADPEDGEPDGRGNAVVAGTPRGASVQSGARTLDGWSCRHGNPLNCGGQQDGRWEGEESRGKGYCFPTPARTGQGGSLRFRSSCKAPGGQADGVLSAVPQGLGELIGGFPSTPRASAHGALAC